MHDDTSRGPFPGRDQAEAVLACAARAYDHYFRNLAAAELFGALLEDLLELTGSSRGAIAEVAPEGEHPAVVGDPGVLDADVAPVLSIALRHGPQRVGRLVLVGRPGGYDAGAADRLAPVAHALGNLIEAYRADAERLRAQRALARSERTLGVLVANISDVLTILEPDGTWRYSSATGARVLGYRMGFDPPGGVFALLHPDDVGLAQQALGEVLDGLRRPDEPVDLRVRAANGEYRVFETVGVNLVHDPAVGGVVLTSHDVTAARTLEARKQEMLDADRAMRIAIEDQNRNLRELANLKNEFVASVSHELRTPVTAIVGFSELLAQDAENFPAPVRESLAYIDANAQRILRLVDDLLLVGRLEARVVTMQPAELCARTLVEEAVAALRPLAREAEVELEVAACEGPMLWADRNRIEQVIGNLVSNAIKFTPAGGRVEVRAERVADAWQLVVRDTGIGIPAEESTRLFHRFFRASNARTEATPGTGLGLVISRAIVELHEGQITLSSTEGEGTTARVILPDRKQDAQPTSGVRTAA